MLALQVLTWTGFAVVLVPPAMLAVSAIAKALPWPLMKDWG